MALAINEEYEVQCPFCGEEITILIDTSSDEQDTVEDCQVCCKPIHFKIRCEDGVVLSVDTCRD